jgi:hypothetical protein
MQEIKASKKSIQHWQKLLLVTTLLLLVKWNESSTLYHCANYRNMAKVKCCKLPQKI